MKKITSAQELIESGILESFVLEQAGPDEVRLVEEMAAHYPEVGTAIDDISRTMESYAHAHSVKPSPAVKPFIMATLNYLGRMESGELPSDPPLLHTGSTIADYTAWLSRPDLQLNQELTDAYAYIIGYTPKAVTAIVWLNQGTLPEIHHAEHEKFLVVEGSCCITIEQQEHHLHAGDTIAIPLHADHYVRVTSDIPCKVILQRIAA